nr:immunoglobulin heavy chain junction region [Mus musculus]
CALIYYGSYWYFDVW